MFEINGITLSIVRTYPYNGDRHDLAQGTTCYELASTDGKYHLMVPLDGQTPCLSDVPMVEAA